MHESNGVRIVNRRQLFLAGPTLLGVALLTPAAAYATAPATADPAQTEAGSPDPDGQLDGIIAKLDTIPEGLRRADPSTYPGYEEALNNALEGVMTIDPQAAASVGSPGDVQAHASAGSCAVEIATVVITYGVPATKVLKWLKEAKQIWGGVRGIYVAIKSGAAATELGAEAAALLGSIIGVTAVAEACFG